MLGLTDEDNFWGQSSGNGAKESAKTTQKITTTKNTLGVSDVSGVWCLFHAVIS